MKSELIKQTFRLGNSAGVILPIDWKDKKVKIQLIDKSITQDILEILDEKDLLKNVIGIFLAGSYARGEETELSDVDVLVITDNINKQMKIREYEIIFISREKFEKTFKTSLYLASLIHEAKTILNNDFIKEYKDKVIEIELKKPIEDIKSIIKINETSISLDEEMKKNVPDETLYSVILRLRELYLIECLKNNKKPLNSEFIELIKKITGSIESYNSYLRIKNDLKPKQIVSIKEASVLIEYMKKKISDLEFRYLKHGKKKQ
jgi:predicted nucleotidyltransferase